MAKRNRKHASTPSERVQKCRARLMDAGGRRLEVLLNPDATQALDELLAHHEGTLRSCIEDVLIRAAKRRKGIKK